MARPETDDAASCAMCQRQMRDGLTKHHLIPKRCHRVKWFRKRYSKAEMQQTVPLCRDCHKAVHHFVPDGKELGRDYSKLEALLAHPEIMRFVAWIKKQR